MNAGSWIQAAAAAAVAVAGLAGGVSFAFLASPLACALAFQAWSLRDGPAADAPRRSIGLAILAAVLGLALAVSGHPWAGFTAAAGGLASALHATRLSLASEPAPRGHAPPAAGDPRLRVGVAADEALRLLLEVRAWGRSRPEFGSVAADARIAADRNREEGWLSRPETAHPPTPLLEKPRVSRAQLRGLGEIEELAFPSEFHTQDPEISRAWRVSPRSRTVRVGLKRKRGRARPALIFVHGASRRELSLGARALGIGELAGQLGADLALYAPPPFGPGGGIRGLLAGDVLWTNAAVGQAVWELRRLTGFLHSEGATSVGVFGLGLGGYVVSAFASVQDGLACAVAMHAPASLDTCFWRLLPPGPRVEARAAGLTRHLLESAWARHAPLRMRPRVPHEARLVIGGLADRIVPPRQVEALWEHWGQPSQHWHAGTHLLWSETPRLRERLRLHLGDTLA